MNPNALPIELRQCRQWVCWTTKKRDGKQTKIPITPFEGGFASTTDSETWGSFEDALNYARRMDVDGIGFVFTDTDPYVGVDLDDCRDARSGALSEDAIAIILRLHSYTEISPSGTGLHILVRGRLPEGPRRRASVEMYEEGRFFTMTGNQLTHTPEQVCQRPAALRSVHQQFVVAHQSEVDRESEVGGDEFERDLSFDPTLDDEELIEKATDAANGEKFTRLWNGDIYGYDSHSEADMALCCLLAFWTDSDVGRIDQLFRQSGLMRSKWDEVHYSDGSTYGERTIERACSFV